MVKAFGRSLSYPPPTTSKAPAKSIHVRSISLPCRSSSNPIISHIKDEINSLKEWQSRRQQTSPVAWFCAAMAQQELLLASLEELLELPQIQEYLHSSSNLAERLLEDFLRLADVHGSFRSEIADLKHNLFESQSAVRRRDEAKLASSSRSQKKTEKELTKLASAAAEISKLPQNDEIINEAISVIAGVSAAMFNEIAGMSSASVCLNSRSSWVSIMAKKRTVEEGEEQRKQRALDKLEVLEECIVELEKRSERLFRSIVKTRVVLLNTLTPSP